MATIDPERLYLQLGQLVAEMPQLAGSLPITADINRWLGQAAYLVEASGGGDGITIRVACDHLHGTLRDMNAQSIMSVVYRALARAEANAPAAARGAFVAIGAEFDALKAIGTVLGEAKADVLIVDAYMDSKVLTDFAPQVAPAVTVRLLSDSHSTRPEALLPAAARWTQQFGAARPLQVRLSAPRALHDRLITADGTLVWSITQSLKDLAARSPALVQRVDPDLARMKAAFYEQVWTGATPIA